jgi:hypothetical protein
VTNWTLPTSGFTNGVYLFPPGWLQPLVVSDVPGYYWYVQASNSISVIEPCSTVSYFDGRQQLKDNLSFVFRAANSATPFNFWWGNHIFYVTFAYEANYAYSGFYNLGVGGSAAHVPFGSYETGPFAYNQLYRSFVFGTTDDLNSSGWLGTGVGLDGFNIGLSYPAQYFSSMPTNASSDLLANQTSWILPMNDYTTFGVGVSGTNFVMTRGVKNVYGLQFLSADLAWNNSAGGTEVLSPGGIIPDESPYSGGTFYVQTAQPQLQTVEYYFTQVPPGFVPGSGPQAVPPLPGQPSFSITNTTLPLVVSVGDSSFHVAGFAKQWLMNGNANVYGYLGQYFDSAYKANPDGSASTNQTGILSEYGDFMATEPGPAVLFTKPDLSQTNNVQGQCTVYAVKVQLDVNHDGTMDLSLGGPDNTANDKPFSFWVNNDHDEPGTGGNPDKDLPLPPYPPDYGYGQIRCQRNLEDFARLWTCGLPKLPPSQGYTVTLNMSQSSGDPAINLYAAYGTNSGIGYLSDTNVAAAQFTQYLLNGQVVFDYSRKLGTISTSQSYNVPLSSDGTPQYTNFLFEGAGIGAGRLTMTISQTTAQGSNVLAQASAWLDLHDVKEFYERAVITNNMSGAISNWTSGVEAVQYASSSALGDDNDLLVFVHGFNVGYGDWLIESDTVFKRLYWSGYHGKFASVKWPCEPITLWSAISLDTDIFNRSELKAYKANTALATYLAQLRNRFAGYRLHLLVHSQGIAVVSEAVKQSGVTFNTYILSQGALPANCYDVNAPIDPTLSEDGLPAEYHTPEWQPMGYHGVYTNFTGRIVKFYNPIDFALGIWHADQALAKPSWYYAYDGTNCWYRGTTGYMVTDWEESRAEVSRSRTGPIGSSGPSSAHGVIQSALDLNAQFGFFDNIAEHSAQWTRPIQTSRAYFQQVLRSCQINPAP